MWLTKIFAREFGFSDVQSNYSRVYAWMANQLGHMTLGLATALLFVWIVETVHAVGLQWRLKGLPGAYCANCEGDCAPTVLWSLAIILVAFGFIGAGWMMRRNRFTFTGVGAIVGVGVYALFTDCAECWNYVLMLTAIGVLALGFALAIWSAGVAPLAIRKVETNMQEKWRLDLDRAVNQRAVALSDARHAMLVLATAAVGIVLIGHTWAEIVVVDDFEGAPPPDHPLMIFAATVAISLFAVACAILCKDPRFIPIYAVILLTAFLTATDGALFGYGDLKGVAQALASVYLLYSTVVIAMLAKQDELFTRIERAVQTIANILIAVGVYLAMTQVHAPEWKLSLAAGMASLCMWWIKEFASDLPNVHKEIAAVILKRHTADGADPLDPSREPAATDRRRALEKEYFRDARVDARADGMFYFAGAWIGAGVLNDVPVLSEDAWPAGSEIFGLMLFLAIFLGLGKNWAYRQLALDLMGARMASRFAVFRSELRMRSLFVAKSGHVQVGALEGGDWLAHPLLKLREFASPRTLENRKIEEPQDEDDQPMHERIDHILIFGDLGSGRSPLGRAIASEAALADWPTRFQIKRRRKVRDDAAKRTARYITGARLRSYVNDISYRSDLTSNPTVTISFDQEKGVKLPQGARNGSEERAADVVVVDDVSITDTQDPGRIEEWFANLSLSQGQQTVWLIDVKDDKEAPSDEILRRAAERAASLLSALAKETGDGSGKDRCHVALALTRRHDDPYAEPVSR